MKSMTSSRALRALAVATALFCLIPAAHAQTGANATQKDIMPSMGTNVTNAREYNVAGAEETHPPVRLTPDRTEMVHLDDDANSIIVGNPAHVNVLMNNSRTLLLAPREPGATQLTVLNASGKVIMQRHVIVSGPKENYVRIRRTCLNGASNCQPTTVYYCPDICHNVQMLAGQNNNQQEGSVPAAGAEPATDAVTSSPTTGPAANIDGPGTGDDDQPLNDDDYDDEEGATDDPSADPDSQTQE